MSYPLLENVRAIFVQFVCQHMTCKPCVSRKTAERENYSRRVKANKRPIADRPGPTDKSDNGLVQSSQVILLVACVTLYLFLGASENQPYVIIAARSLNCTTRGPITN